jgi:hypothetical protein
MAESKPQETPSAKRVTDRRGKEPRAVVQGNPDPNADKTPMEMYEENPVSPEGVPYQAPSGLTNRNRELREATEEEKELAEAGHIEAKRTVQNIDIAHGRHQDEEAEIPQAYQAGSGVAANK